MADEVSQAFGRTDRLVDKSQAKAGPSLGALRFSRAQRRMTECAEAEKTSGKYTRKAAQDQKSD